jgi:hypothetical protein
MNDDRINEVKTFFASQPDSNGPTVCLAAAAEKFILSESTRIWSHHPDYAVVLKYFIDSKIDKIPSPALKNFFEKLFSFDNILVSKLRSFNQQYGISVSIGDIKS